FPVKFAREPVRGRLDVASVAALLSVRVPALRIPFVGIVKVEAVVGLNCTFLNAVAPMLQKVMARERAELKTIVPVPADQDPLVDAFAQEPLNVHVAGPKAKNPEAAMLTLPLMVFAPAAPPEMPPAMLAARPATVKGKV